MSAEKNYHFNVGDAVKYGLEEAVILNNFRFSIDGHRANGTHFYEGRWWTFDSVRAYCLLYPFWTARQMDRIIKSLIDQKVIMTGNFNKMKYDQTHWYAFVDQEKMLFSPISPKGELDTRKRVKTISPNREMVSTEPLNEFHQTVKPIPTLNPTHIPNHILKEGEAPTGSMVPSPMEPPFLETDGGKLWQAIYTKDESIGMLPLKSDKAGTVIYFKQGKETAKAIVAEDGLKAAMAVFKFAYGNKYCQPVKIGYYKAYKARYLSEHGGIGETPDDVNRRVAARIEKKMKERGE